jgi:segregation and condensation protein B
MIRPEEQDSAILTQEMPSFAETSSGVSSGMSLKGRVEAVLFLTGVPLSAASIAEQLGAQLYAVEDALMDLISDYNNREDASALEIDDTDGYILQVKALYTSEVRQMVPMELSAGVLRTLSAIAIKAPVKQSALVDLRGSSAYDHIGELVSKKLVSRRKQGRSFVLDVTPAFQSHFKLSGNKSELSHLLELSQVTNAMAQALDKPDSEFLAELPE